MEIALAYGLASLILTYFSLTRLGIYLKDLTDYWSTAMFTLVALPCFIAIALTLVGEWVIKKVTNYHDKDKEKRPMSSE